MKVESVERDLLEINILGTKQSFFLLHLAYMLNDFAK